MSQHFDILIVDDEQVIVNAASKVFIREGFKIDEAVNADSALQKLQQNSYKLIISDLMLPRISGIELIKNVNRTNPEIPIIIITGYAMLENAVQCFKAGAFDFIPKPFDIPELLGVVFRAMKHGEMMRKSSQPENRIQPVAAKQAGDKKTGAYYFLGQHSWAKLDNDSIIRCGVGGTFPGRMGTIRQVELPSIYTDIWQGNLCVRIISEEQLMHMVWAPITGKVIEINHEIEKNPHLIDTDPLDQGWLIKIIPTNLENELENLIPE